MRRLNPPDPVNLLHFVLTARACQFATQFDQTFTDCAGAGCGVTTPIEGWYYHEQTAAYTPGGTVTATRMPGFGQTDMAAPAAVIGAA